MQEHEAARKRERRHGINLSEDAAVAARQKQNAYRARRKAAGKDRAAEARNKAQRKALEHQTSLDFSSFRLIVHQT